MEVDGDGQGSPAAEPFYDARRGVCYAKPVLRGWPHLVWFGASLVLGPLLLARAPTQPRPGGQPLTTSRKTNCGHMTP